MLDVLGARCAGCKVRLVQMADLPFRIGSVLSCHSVMAAGITLKVLASLGALVHVYADRSSRLTNLVVSLLNITTCPTLAGQVE